MKLELLLAVVSIIVIWMLLLIGFRPEVTSPYRDDHNYARNSNQGASH